MDKFKKMIYRCLYILWGLILYISTIAGFASIVSNIKFLSHSSFELGFYFSTYSFYYIMYKLGKNEV